jgi:hypothetical protein
MMFFGSLVVISLWLQYLHTGVPHPMQDVSVWIPHAQTSSFRAGCIEIPLSCLVDDATVMKGIAISMPRGKAGAIRGLR